MNPVFIRVIQEKFSNQFIIESNEDVTFIKFPAKNTDFGDVQIYEDAPGKYVIEMGKFSHSHIDIYDGTDDEKAKDAAEDVCDFLDQLFTDCIICFGSRAGGGWFTKEYESEAGTDQADLYVWSGKYIKRSHGIRIIWDRIRSFLIGF